MSSTAQAPAQSARTVTSPEKFFGFQMGADRKLVRWDKAVEYYRLLERESGGKLKVVDMGPTEMGNPFLLVIVTSPANQARLEELRQIVGAPADNRIYQYLGVVTWFWKLTLTRVSARLELIVARVPSIFFWRSCSSAR